MTRPTFIRAIICAVCVALPSIPGTARADSPQDLTDPPRAVRPAAPQKALPSLVEASRLARDPARGGLAAAAAKLAGVGYRTLDGADLRFEVVAAPGLEPLVSAAIDAQGGTVVRSVRDRIEGRVPLEHLEDLAASLPEGAFIEPSGYGQVQLATEGQGPTIQRDGPYRDLGFDGSGIKIAVIDVGFSGLSTSRLTGDAPAVSTNVNLSALSFEAPADGNHGRFVMETIYDHAPGAQYFIYKIDNQTQASQAIDLAAAQGVDIISMSLGYFPQWYDGALAITQAADDAAAQGVLVFNSAGNSADGHWEGAFADPDGDGFITWGPGNDEVLQCTIPAGKSASAFLTFNRDGGNHDYDLFLYNVDASVLLDSSVNPGESFESVSYPNNGNAPIIVQLVVERVAGPGTVLEVYVGKDTQMDEFIVPGSSVLSPSDASHPNVISVGAVEQAAYGSSSFTSGIQATYSSRGPTNGLQLVPDICAPTSTSGSFFGSFTGTSCACPHAAGLTAALWSAGPAVPAAQIRGLLYQYAEGKDWGSVGHDFIFGVGGANLPTLADCNLNNWPDAFDIVSGTSADVNENGKPDECDPSGFAFGLLAPDYPPIFEFVLIATLDPDALPTTSDPLVSGVDMVFGFDPSIVQIDAVEPSPELVALIGGSPVEFTTETVGGALGVRCNFAADPATGAPAGFAIPVSTPMLHVVCSVVPGANGGTAGGPLEVTFGLEDQPIGLLLPAIQKIRAIDGGGSPYELSPILISSAASFPVVDLPHHGYQIVAGVGVAPSGDEIGDTIAVEVDPLAPGTAFSVIFRARQAFEGTAETATVSAAVAVDPSVLTPTGASSSSAVDLLAPELFLVQVGSDGVAVDCTWSTTGTATVPLGTVGLEIASIDLETTAVAVPAVDSPISTRVSFDTPRVVAVRSEPRHGAGLRRDAARGGRARAALRRRAAGGNVPAR